MHFRQASLQLEDERLASAQQRQHLDPRWQLHGSAHLEDADPHVNSGAGVLQVHDEVLGPTLEFVRRGLGGAASAPYEVQLPALGAQNVRHAHRDLLVEHREARALHRSGDAAGEAGAVQIVADANGLDARGRCEVELLEVERSTRRLENGSANLHGAPTAATSGGPAAWSARSSSRGIWHRMRWFSSTSTSIPHSVGWQFMGHMVRVVVIEVSVKTVFAATPCAIRVRRWLATVRSTTVCDA